MDEAMSSGIGGNYNVAKNAKSAWRGGWPRQRGGGRGGARKPTSKPAKKVVDSSKQAALDNGAENPTTSFANLSTPSHSSVDEKSLHMKILNMSSTTPMPDFDTMNDAQINVELNRFGMRPVCRSKAVRILRRIYEATHPVNSDGTPLARRVAKSLLKTQKRSALVSRADKARERRIRTAISKFNLPSVASQKLQSNAMSLNCFPADLADSIDPTSTDVNMDSSIIEVECIASSSSSATYLNPTSSDPINLASFKPLSSMGSSSPAKTKKTGRATKKVQKTNGKETALPSSSTLSSSDEIKKGDTEHLLRTFLDWLRQPANEELYYELLTLNPVLLERLITDFGEELRTQKISRTKFAELLDRIHVTYCIPQHDNNHH